jgi:hypothetical protein
MAGDIRESSVDEQRRQSLVVVDELVPMVREDVVDDVTAPVP